MANSININQNNNGVTLQDNNGGLSITNNNTGTTINVTQPVTNVVTVATPGPQGPAGIPITSGSFTGSFSGSFIGDLTGTASNATSASYAINASNATSASYATSASNATNASNATSASYAQTASYVTLAQTASYVTTAQTASYILQAVSASYALTASYLEGYISPFPYSGSAVITGSLTVSGSSTLTNIGPAIFSGSLIVTQGITGSLFGTSSYALTASYAMNGGSGDGNFIATGSISASVSIGTGSFTITSGSSTFMFVSSSGNVGFGTTTPTAPLTVLGTSGFDAIRFKSQFSSNGYFWTSNTLIGIGTAASVQGTNLSLGPNGVGIKFGSDLTPTSALHIQGFGSTSATTALLVQNNAGTQTGKIDNQGNTTWGSNTSSGTHTFQGYNVAMITLSDTLNGYSTTLYKNAASGYLIENSSTNKLSYGYSGNYWMSWHGSLKAIAVSSTASEPTPATTAILDLQSTTKGFLPTRTNLTSNISSPAQGLMTYVTASATEGLYYYNSGSLPGWNKILTNSGSQDISGSLNVTSFTASNATISGNVTVLGTASINTLIVNQTQLSTGSNQLGDAADDFQTLYGTVTIPTGSLTVSGSITQNASTASFGGLVGIGTTTPNANLDINATYTTSGFPLSIKNTGYFNAYFQGTNANNQAAFYLDNNRGSFQSYGGFMYGGSTSNLGNLFGLTRPDRLFMFADGASNVGYAIGTLQNVPLQFGTNNNIRATIFGNGNIGIGTTTDAGYKLDVNGTARVQSTTTIGTSSHPFSTNLLTLISDQGSNSMRIGGGGRLDITGGMNAATLQSTDFVQAVRFLVGNGLARLTATTTNWLSVTDTSQSSNGSGNLSVNQATFGTTYATINASAQVQIDSTTKGFLPPRTNLTSNISSPAQGLITYLTGSTNEGLYYYNSGSTPGWRQVADTTFVSASLSGSTGYLPVFTGANSVSSSVIFQSGSNVGIGTVTPSYILDVNGNGRIGGILIQDTISDQRITANRPYFFLVGGGAVLQMNGGNFSTGQYNTTAKFDIKGTGTTSATTALLVQNANASASLAVLDNSNVGIGTTTASYRLSVLAPSAGDGIAAYVGSAAMIMTGNAGSGNPGIGSTTGVIHVNATLNGTGGNEVLNVNKSANGAYIQAWRSFASTPLSLVDGNGNFAIRRTSATASLDVAGTTRLSGSFNTAISGSILTVQGSGSAQPIFTVQGSQGELFSITDSLSGSLFSVNDISGLPILEVFSDNTTLIGNYQDPMLITTAKVVQTNSGSFTMYSLPTASYDTAFFEYSVRSGSNARAGTIMAIQSGSAVNFTETTTTDFGSTSAVSFTIIVTGSNMALTGSSTSGAWTIKTIVRGI
jgi:hypothetical protein